jgi:hypothetical protein
MDTDCYKFEFSFKSVSSRDDCMVVISEEQCLDFVDFHPDLDASKALGRWLMEDSMDNMSSVPPDEMMKFACSILSHCLISQITNATQSEFEWDPVSGWNLQDKGKAEGWVDDLFHISYVLENATSIAAKFTPVTI